MNRSHKGRSEEWNAGDVVGLSLCLDDELYASSLLEGLWNARLFLYQLRSDRTGIRGVFDDTREEAYSGADREPVAAG